MATGAVAGRSDAAHREGITIAAPPTDSEHRIGERIAGPGCGDEEARPRSDASTERRSAGLYSLGVILFELLTCERPFRGNVRMLVHQVINDEAPSPRRLNGAVPRDLETICLKCLEKESAQRYPTAEALASDLRRFRHGESIQRVPSALRNVPGAGAAATRESPLSAWPPRRRPWP